MEEFITFVREWGYAAVFLGSLVEGESVILTASAMAAQGYLSLKYVMIIAFVGTTIADQALYFLGYNYGETILKRFKSFHKPSEKAFQLLKKYDVLFILSCRFIYGIRVASAIVIGAAKIPPKRFILLNIVSAAVWAVLSCCGGYYLGGKIFAWFNESDGFQRNLFLSIAALSILGYFGLKIIKLIRK